MTTMKLYVFENRLCEEMRPLNGGVKYATRVFNNGTWVDVSVNRDEFNSKAVCLGEAIDIAVEVSKVVSGILDGVSEPRQVAEAVFNANRGGL